MRALAFIALLPACAKHTAAPPANTSPVAFTATRIAAGDRGTIELDAANTTDSELGGYELMYRFTDAGGSIVPIVQRFIGSDGRVASEEHVMFETDSFFGGDTICAPKTTCHLVDSHVRVPAGAVHAEIRAVHLDAIIRDPSGSASGVRRVFERPATAWPAEPQ